MSKFPKKNIVVTHGIPQGPTSFGHNTGWGPSWGYGSHPGWYYDPHLYDDIDQAQYEMDAEEWKAALKRETAERAEAQAKAIADAEASALAEAEARAHANAKARQFEEARQQAEHQAEEARRQLSQRHAEEALRHFTRQITIEAEQSAKRDHDVREKKNTDAYIKHSHEAGRIWSVIAGPYAPAQQLPSITDKATEAAKRLFIRKAAETIGRQIPIIAALYTSDLDSGEREPQIFKADISDMGISGDIDLSFIATNNGTINVTHRLVQAAEAKSVRFKWVMTDGVSVGPQVRVRPAVYDPITNIYTFTRDGESTPTFTWTPQVAQPNSSTALPASNPDTTIYAGNLAPESAEPYTYPECSSTPDDYIIVLPVELGLENPYVYFKNPRQVSGTVTGYGQPAAGTWLGDNTNATGARIPSQIADRLRGQRFPNFDKFREALWESVGNDSELASQLSSANLAQVKRGKAPYPKKSDQVGGRDKYEIHHIEEVGKGGAVYEIDNMVIMTPKQHIKHHKGEKQ